MAGVIAAPRMSARSRILAIDALRGLALILMALDHAATFVMTGLQAETYGGQPAILEGASHWLSGLLTNLAAPTFWLLSGVSVALFAAGRRRAGDSEWAITRFLLIRAGAILLLDLTICEWAWLRHQTPYLHVLLSLAISIALLSVLRLLPVRVFAALTLLLLLGYQVMLPWIVQLGQPESLGLALLLSYNVGIYPAVEFSVLGWSGLTCLGFLLGQHIGAPALRQPRSWLAIGAGLLGLWLALRLAGGFGDLVAYTADQPWYHLLIMGKTPPTLTYLAFNLGLAALLMACFCFWDMWLERPALRWLAVCGQVSLFFFVMHIVIYGLLGRIVLALDLPLPSMVRAYMVWLIGLGVLIPLAFLYRDLRKRNPRSLLRYL
jgi:uncharacterized membrane protein